MRLRFQYRHRKCSVFAFQSKQPPERNSNRTMKLLVDLRLLQIVFHDDHNHHQFFPVRLKLLMNLRRHYRLNKIA